MSVNGEKIIRQGTTVLQMKAFFSRAFCADVFKPRPRAQEAFATTTCLCLSSHCVSIGHIGFTESTLIRRHLPQQKV